MRPLATVDASGRISLHNRLHSPVQAVALVIISFL